VRSLEELIRFNQAHANRVMPYFQQELLEMAQARGDLSEDAYQEAKSECRRLSRTDGIDLPPAVVPSFKLGWGLSQARAPGGA